MTLYLIKYHFLYSGYSKHLQRLTYFTVNKHKIEFPLKLFLVHQRRVTLVYKQIALSCLPALFLEL